MPVTNPRVRGSEWQATQLGNVVELKCGYNLPAHRRQPGSVPVVSSSGITDYHAESKVTGPGVVTGRYGTLGQVYFLSGDYWPLNTTLYVNDFKGNDPRFVSYLLQGINFAAYSDKSAVPGLNRNDLHRAPVRIPTSVAGQRAIAHVLGTLDDKIELNRRMDRTLEAMARALFTSWFVDFEPVRAKQDGRDTGLPGEVAALFPNRLVDSGSGAIPHGWETSEIGSEVKIAGGATPSTKEPAYWDEGAHHWATPKDLSPLSSPVLLETGRKITAAGVGRIASGILPVGTVLLSSRAPIGYLAIAAVPVAVNQGFIAMVCDRRLPNLYVLFWCSRNLDYVRSIAGGSTFAEISKRAFRPLPVIVPPAPVLAAWTGLVRPLYDRMVANARQCAPLTGMRDTLLRQLMAGRIRIADAKNGPDRTP